MEDKSTNIFFFTEWSQWCDTAKSCALMLLTWSRLLLSCVFGGLVSLALAIWGKSVLFVGRHPSFSIASFLLVLFCSCAVLYATMSSRLVHAQDEIDSLSYTFMLYRHNYSPSGCEYVILNGDTVYIW